MAIYSNTIEHGTWRIAADSDSLGNGWRANYWNDADPGGQVYQTGLHNHPEEAEAAARTAIDTQHTTAQASNR